ncbi:TatD DNase family protein [Spiroplasma chinense]|uniref:TatD DNase family protein n=1 Tax=Spiroplasma chinense TaxID=216932 RepID=A0A5B9Y6E2_9MOLU|nr:TatD family hydrolase [Spiroplasma chinense]QEH62415.1 TatD DNase family protein [Spiroplasma chinense]
MAGIFDTHTHFTDERYKEEGMETKEMINDAKAVGVANFCCVGYDVESSKKSAKYAMEFDEVFCAVGIHPTEAHTINEKDISEIEILAHADKTVAIGEIGLDYYYTDEYVEVQKEIFRKQIAIALDNDLAVMLHLRDRDGSDQAYLDALEILEEMEVKRAIVHCYTRGYDLAQKFVSKGYYISIPGVVTFDNAKDLHEAVQKLTINNILVETDAPYLTPVPHRGRINTTKEIVHTVEKIAKLKNLNKDDVAEITTRNAKKIFNLQ